MATKKQPTAERKADLSNQLYKIRTLIGLCSFAAEARRTLHDIELATQICPDIGKSLSRLVEARNQWCENEDSLSAVLNDINFQLDAVITLVDGLEV